jgi:hypothetical protein
LAGQLPANVTDTAVVLVRLPGAAGVVSRQLNTEVSELPVETAEPIRRFYSWTGKRNYDGRWWFSTTGRHVVFESLLERDALMMADFTAEVIAASAQPLAFLWPRGTAHAAHHVPDYFLRLADGGGRVVDVKRADALVGARTQIALTETACAEIGWQYRVFTGITPPLDQNVRWLSGYRHDRYRPDRGVLVTIDNAFSSPAPLSDGASSAAARRALPVSIVLGHLYHCLWIHHLHADLSVPLTMTTAVSR